MRQIVIFLFLLCSILFTSACQSDKPESTAQVESTTSVEKDISPVPVEIAPIYNLPIFMEEAITLHRGETIAESLPIWRSFKEQRPTLLLLSNDPTLLQPPQELLDNISNVLTTGTSKELLIAGNPLLSNPLFLPNMTVDIALRQNWLRQLVWGFPLINPETEVNLKKMRDQFGNRHLADDHEIASLELIDNVFSAQLRGIPFTAAALHNLPIIDGPIIIHIDLSYFQKLYKNGVKTPVIPLVGNILKQLKEMKLSALAVTFSYNHRDGGIPLDVRFIGDFIASLIQIPEQLNQPLSPIWQAQNDILYLDNFFQKDKIEILIRNQAKEAPNTPWVEFNQYNFASNDKNEETALAHLARAVELDAMYATEYDNLAQHNSDSLSIVRKLALTQLASISLPDNPILKLKTAEIALAAGEFKTALHLVDELRRETWSPIYYRNVKQYLDDFAKDLNLKIESID